MKSRPSSFCRNFCSASRSLPTPWNEVLTASTSRIACSEESAALPVSFIAEALARNDRMVCGCLSSRTVKSCCCKPGTGFPDLSVTTTSSVMRRPESPVEEVALSGGAVSGNEEAPCGANPVSEEQRKRAVKTGDTARMLPHIDGPLITMLRDLALLLEHREVF